METGVTAFVFPALLKAAATQKIEALIQPDAGPTP